MQILCLTRWRLQDTVLLSADDALHPLDSTLLADGLEVDSTQKCDWQLMPASFASTVGLAFSIRACTVSQASSVVFHTDACHTDIYIVVYSVGRPGC